VSPTFIDPVYFVERGRKTPSSRAQLFKERSMSKLVLRFLNDDSGATAIEYGLIAAGISVTIIAVVNGVGTKLNTTFSSISSQLK
jgi:pilus assembly protein Flp/PilA